MLLCSHRIIIIKHISEEQDLSWQSENLGAHLNGKFSCDIPEFCWSGGVSNTGNIQNDNIVKFYKPQNTCQTSTTHRFTRIHRILLSVLPFTGNFLWISAGIQRNIFILKLCKYGSCNNILYIKNKETHQLPISITRFYNPRMTLFVHNCCELFVHFMHTSSRNAHQEYPQCDLTMMNSLRWIQEYGHYIYILWNTYEGIW